jgi:AcrR family transcriptional regulator
VDQIARAAGTTRTTFYQYFKTKGDLIHFMQREFIAPEMTAICLSLDELREPTWQDLRNWVTEYSRTWDRIHLFFEAYSEAATTDHEVAEKAIPQTYEITSHMTQLLGRFQGVERQRVHDKLVILVSVIAQMLALTKGQRDDPRNSHLLDNFTDLFWDALFSRLPGTKIQQPIEPRASEDNSKLTSKHVSE